MPLPDAFVNLILEKETGVPAVEISSFVKATDLEHQLIATDIFFINKNF